MNATGNGHVERDLLGPPKTAGYRPSVASIPGWFDWPNIGLFSLGIVDEMRRDPVVQLSLEYKKSPCFAATFKIESKNPEVAKFVEKQVQRHWQKSLSATLQNLEYGYMAGEPLYKEDNGTVNYDGLKPLHPRDVKPYTYKGMLAFVRVQRIIDDWATSGRSEVDLEAARPGKPAKGFWISHNGGYAPWWGRSILAPCWWPWRLKTMPDGASESAAKFCYRFGFAGMVVRHPESIYQDSPSGTPVSAKDMARDLANSAKAGANFTLSSEKDMKGDYLWNIESYGGKMEGQAGNLTGYIDFLDKQIMRGMLVPDEIIAHDGATGGYSRSQVSAAAFIQAAEQIVDHQLTTFDDQICRPLVRLNFGDVPYTIKAEPLLTEKQQGALQGAPAPGAGGEGGEEPSFQPSDMPAMPMALSLSHDEQLGISDSVQSAGRWLAGKWHDLEDRYGSKAALAMAVGMIATLPLPGNIAAIVGAAEAARGLHGYFKGDSKGTCKPGQRSDLTGCDAAEMSEGEKVGDEVAWVSGRQTVAGTIEEITGNRMVVRITSLDRKGPIKIGDKISVVSGSVQPIAMSIELGFSARQQAVRHIKQAGARMVKLTEDVLDEEIKVGQWRKEMAREIEQLHDTAARMAYPNMDAGEEAAVARMIVDQKQYLADFAKELRAGTVEGSAAARAEMYAHAAYGTFEEMKKRQKVNWGYGYERRILDPKAEHCKDCIRAAKRGWVKVGKLPKIGQTQCLTRCRCRFEYRKDKPTA